MNSKRQETFEQVCRMLADIETPAAVLRQYALKPDLAPELARALASNPSIPGDCLIRLVLLVPLRILADNPAMTLQILMSPEFPREIARTYQEFWNRLKNMREDEEADQLKLVGLEMRATRITAGFSDEPWPEWVLQVSVPSPREVCQTIWEMFSVNPHFSTEQLLSVTGSRNDVMRGMLRSKWFTRQTRDVQPFLQRPDLPERFWEWALGYWLQVFLCLEPEDLPGIIEKIPDRPCLAVDPWPQGLQEFSPGAAYGVYTRDQRIREFMGGEYLRDFDQALAIRRHSGSWDASVPMPEAVRMDPPSPEVRAKVLHFLGNGMWHHACGITTEEMLHAVTVRKDSEGFEKVLGRLRDAMRSHRETGREYQESELELCQWHCLVVEVANELDVDLEPFVKERLSQKFLSISSLALDLDAYLRIQEHGTYFAVRLVHERMMRVDLRGDVQKSRTRFLDELVIVMRNMQGAGYTFRKASRPELRKFLNRKPSGVWGNILNSLRGIASIGE